MYRVADGRIVWRYLLCDWKGLLARLTRGGLMPASPAGAVAVLLAEAWRDSLPLRFRGRRRVPKR